MKNKILFLLLFPLFLNAQAEQFFGIGALYNNSAEYRIRTTLSNQLIQLEYSEFSDFSNSTITSGVNSGNENIGGEIIPVGLNSRYYYRVLVDNNIEIEGEFSSYGQSTTRIGFGSCNFTPNGGAYAAIKGWDLTFFSHLGDFGYPNNSLLANQRANHRAQNILGTDYHNLLLSTPILKTWDDHDFGSNNSNGTNTLKNESLQAWYEYNIFHNLANPNNGIWHSFDIATKECGNINMIVLDNRFQRSEFGGERFPATGTILATITGSTISFSGNTNTSYYDGFFFELPNGEVRRLQNWNGISGTLDKTPVLQGSQQIFGTKRSILDGFNLGAGNQIDWLINSINNTTATRHIINSSSPINTSYKISTSADAKDTWGGFDEENLEWEYITQEITKTNIIIFSADRHYVGFDDGANSTYPEFCAGPIERNALPFEGNWSIGTYDQDHAFGVYEIDSRCVESVLAINSKGNAVLGYKLSDEMCGN